MLLIGEERGERVRDAAEELVDEADGFGDVRAMDGIADSGGERGEGGCVRFEVRGSRSERLLIPTRPAPRYGWGTRRVFRYRVEAADRGRKVLVAEVEHGEANLFGLLGNAGADARAAKRDPAAAGGEGVPCIAIDGVAEEVAVFGIGAEDGADGVVGAHLFEPDAKAEDVAAVKLGGIAELRDIGFGAGEDFEELVFERSAGGPEEFGGELDNAACVCDDLNGLNA